jgi:S1-C subfamily serine protease
MSRCRPTTRSSSARTVIAIGNPYGLSHTVTVGVAALPAHNSGGDIVYRDFIQTDASINPGNSGGALLNIEGKLLGINTAIFARRRASASRFPRTVHARRGADRPSRRRADRRGSAVITQDLTPDLAFHFDTEPGSGVLIAEVEQGSPAETAVLAAGQSSSAWTASAWELRPIQSAHARRQPTGTRRRWPCSAGKNRRSVSCRGGAPCRRNASTNSLGRGSAWPCRPMPGGLVVSVAAAANGAPRKEIGILPGDAITALGGHDVDGVGAVPQTPCRGAHQPHVLLSVLRGRRLYRVTLPFAR